MTYRMSTERKHKKRTQKVLELGGSSYICLPRDFCGEHGIRKGDTVEVLYDGSVIVVPIKEEDIRREIEKIKESVK